jgi:hypothetical protein
MRAARAACTTFAPLAKAVRMRPSRSPVSPEALPEHPGRRQRHAGRRPWMHREGRGRGQGMGSPSRGESAPRANVVAVRPPTPPRDHRGEGAVARGHHARPRARMTDGTARSKSWGASRGAMREGDRYSHGEKAAVHRTISPLPAAPGAPALPIQGAQSAAAADAPKTLAPFVETVFQLFCTSVAAVVRLRSGSGRLDGLGCPQRVANPVPYPRHLVCRVAPLKGREHDTFDRVGHRVGHTRHIHSLPPCSVCSS